MEELEISNCELRIADCGFRILASLPYGFAVIKSLRCALSFVVIGKGIKNGMILGSKRCFWGQKWLFKSVRVILRQTFCTQEGQYKC